MDYSAIHPTAGTPFTQKCPKCDKINEVSFETQDGHNEHEEYYCANCNTELGKQKASLSPRTAIVDSPLDIVLKKIERNAGSLNDFLQKGISQNLSKNEVESFLQNNLKEYGILVKEYGELTD